MIKILSILKESFINEDLVLNQEYILEQDENLFSFYNNNNKIAFRGSITKTYHNDDVIIFLTDEMGGIIKFCFA